MKIEKMVWSALLVLCVFVTCGDACWPVPQPGTPAGGFPVTTNAQVFDSAGNLLASGPVPNIYVTGGWLSDEYNEEGVDIAAGSLENFAVTTDANGNAYVANGRVNANWSTSITWNPACNGYTLDFGDVDDLQPLVGIPWICTSVAAGESANSSTHFVLSGAAPSTVTSYGDFSTTYGEPELRVYVGGSAPGLVSSVSASSAVPGSSATFPFPRSRMGRRSPRDSIPWLIRTQRPEGAWFLWT